MHSKVCLIMFGYIFDWSKYFKEHCEKVTLVVRIAKKRRSIKWNIE